MGSRRVRIVYDDGSERMVNEENLTLMAKRRKEKVGRVDFKVVPPKQEGSEASESVTKETGANMDDNVSSTILHLTGDEVFGLVLDGFVLIGSLLMITLISLTVRSLIKTYRCIVNKNREIK